MNHLKIISNLRFIRSLHRTTNKLQTTRASRVTTEKKTDEELVPSKPVPSKINLGLLPLRTEIDNKTITLLERLSLVDSVNKHEVKVLEDAIQFADQILQVNTRGIEPLITVLEDRPLQTREDIVTEGNIKDEILLNASCSDESYFVSPPGNIPLDNPVHEDEIIEREEEAVPLLPNVDSSPANY